MVDYWFTQVTPCELEGLSARTVVLRDVASERDASERRYRVELIGEDGDALSAPRWLTGAAGKLEIPLPELERKYVVVRVTVERAGTLAPRPMEVHLIQERGTPHVVGVRL